MRCGSRSGLVDRIAYSSRITDDSSSSSLSPTSVDDRNSTVSRDAQGPSRTTGLFRGTAHDKVRYRAPPTSRFSAVKAPPDLASCCAVVTSASINGTLDVTRRPNFPGSRGAFALRVLPTCARPSAVDLGRGCPRRLCVKISTQRIYDLDFFHFRSKANTFLWA